MKKQRNKQKLQNSKTKTTNKLTNRQTPHPTPPQKKRGGVGGGVWIVEEDRGGYFDFLCGGLRVKDGDSLSLSLSLSLSPPPSVSLTFFFLNWRYILLSASMPFLRPVFLTEFN